MKLVRPGKDRLNAFIFPQLRDQVGDSDWQNSIFSIILKNHLFQTFRIRQLFLNRKTANITYGIYVTVVTVIIIHCKKSHSAKSDGSTDSGIEDSEPIKSKTY